MTRNELLEWLDECPADWEIIYEEDGVIDISFRVEPEEEK